MGCTQSKEETAAARELDKELLASSKQLNAKAFLPATPASSSKELQSSSLSVMRQEHSTEHRDSKNRYFPATPDRAPVAPEKQSQSPAPLSKNSNSTKNSLPSSPKSSQASKTSAESLSSSIHTLEYAGQLSVTLANDSAHGHNTNHDPAMEALHHSYGSLNSHDRDSQKHGTTNKRRPPKQTSHSSSVTTASKRRSSSKTKMLRSMSPPARTPSSEEDDAAAAAVAEEEEPTVDTRRSTRSSRTRSSHIPDNESRSPRKKSHKKKKKKTSSDIMDGSQQQLGASISSMDVTDSTADLDVSGSTAASSSSRRARRTSGASLLGNDEEDEEERRKRRRHERKMKRDKKERERAEQEAEGIQDTGLHQMLLDHPSSHTRTDNDNSRRSSRSKVSLHDSVKSARTSSSKKSTASSKRSKRSSSDKKKKKRSQKSSSSSKPKKNKTSTPATAAADHSHIPINDPRMTEPPTQNDSPSVLTQGMDGPSQHSALSGPSQHSLQSYLPEMMKSADVLETNGDSLLTTQKSSEESKTAEDGDHDAVEVALKEGATFKQVNGSIRETGNQKPSSKSRRQSSSNMVSSMVKSLKKKSDNNGRVALIDSDDEESIDLCMDTSDKSNHEGSKSSRVMSKVMKQIKKMPNIVKSSDSHTREGQDSGHTRESVGSDQGADRGSVQWARNPAPKNINMLEDLAPPDPVVFKFDSSDSSIAQFDPTTLEEPGHDSCTEVDRIHKRHSLKDTRSRTHSARDILRDQKEQSLCEGEQKKTKKSKKGRDLPEKHSSRSSTKSNSMRDDSLKDSSMKDRSSRRQRLRLSEEAHTPANPSRRASRRLSGDVPRIGNNSRRGSARTTTKSPA